MGRSLTLPPCLLVLAGKNGVAFTPWVALPGEYTPDVDQPLLSGTPPCRVEATNRTDIVTVNRDHVITTTPEMAILSNLPHHSSGKTLDTRRQNLRAPRPHAQRIFSGIRFRTLEPIDPDAQTLLPGHRGLSCKLVL
ncbi:hypothetical protein AVEN_211000-1 [Araneus ventricosus]|uniref:Uncharacterized protein n=1 Tax=Araneus ventricosus TaxID=182803 RepID=A0A4Y2UAA1_ARAVE|nr:hypothetical protein AVEN_211000-1 [Araneus ventricosus]